MYCVLVYSKPRTAEAQLAVQTEISLMSKT